MRPPCKITNRDVDRSIINRELLCCFKYLKFGKMRNKDKIKTEKVARKIGKKADSSTNAIIDRRIAQKIILSLLNFQGMVAKYNAKRVRAKLRERAGRKLNESRSINAAPAVPLAGMF